MPHDYLGTLASSCAVESLFSTTANVCTANQGQLNPSTMTHCVSSMMCLRQNLPLSNTFQDVQATLEALLPQKKNSK